MAFSKINRYVLICLIILSYLGITPIKVRANQLLKPLSEAPNWEFPLSHFGYPAVIRLSGQIAERTLYLPIPDGLQPKELRGVIRYSSDVQSGYLEVYANDQLVDTITLDRSAQKLQISLEKIIPQTDVLPIRLVARLRSVDDVCVTALAGAWLQWEEASLLLTGTPQPPQTVADYFPAYLEKVSIFLPSQPSNGQTQVALKLAAMLARRYAGKLTQINLATLPQGKIFLQNSSFERSVVIGEGDKGISLFPAKDGTLPVLTITGDDQELTKIAGTFDQTYFPLLAAPQIQILNYTSPAEIQGKQVTLQALGYASQQVSGEGRMDVTVAFSQADLGGAVSGIFARLVGNYTPVPEEASGTVSVLFNSALVYSRLLKQESTFDFYIRLPQMLIQRDNTLVLRFDYTPKGGDCRVGVHPFTAELFNASYLQVDYGNGLPEGFVRFPQALFPRFEVALQPQTSANVARALMLISELQRMTKSPLDFQVVNWDDAVNSHQPALLIREDGQGLEALHPPLLPMPLRVIDLNGKELLRVEENTSFAALEAFEQNQRDVLLLTGQRQPAILDKALDCIKTSPNGWYSLLGDVLFVGQDNGCGVNLALRKSGLYLQPLKPSWTVWWIRIRPYAFAILLFFLLAMVVWAYPKVVRKQPPRL